MSRNDRSQEAGTSGTEHQRDLPDMRMIQELAAKAECIIHCYPHHYIAVVEDVWPDCDESTPIGERKPFMRAFPDTPQGYEAMFSALVRRFPELVTPTVVCSVCCQSKSYTQFDARFLGKRTRKLCQDCRESEQRAARERYEQEKFALEAARSDYVSRFPAHEYEFMAAFTAVQMHAIAERVENEDAWAIKWRDYCVALGFTRHDMRHVLEIHSAISHGKEQWSELKERFLALMPPYLGTLGRKKTRSLSRDEAAVLYDAQGGRCAYCHVELLPLSYRRFHSRMVRAKDLPDWDGQGDEMELITVDGDRIAQIEHRIPIARGGADESSNLVLACRACNLRKGVRTDEEYARIPNDPISQFEISPQVLLMALEYERRGYARFADGVAYGRLSGVYHTIDRDM